MKISICTLSAVLATTFIAITAYAGEKVRLTGDQLKERISKGYIIAGKNITNGNTWTITQFTDGSRIFDYRKGVESLTHHGKVTIEGDNFCGEYPGWGKSCWEIYDLGDDIMESKKIGGEDRNIYVRIKAPDLEVAPPNAPDKVKLTGAQLAEWVKNDYVEVGYNMASGMTYTVTHFGADSWRISDWRVGHMGGSGSGKTEVVDDSICVDWVNWGKRCYEFFDLGNGRYQSHRIGTDDWFAFRITSNLGK